MNKELVNELLDTRSASDDTTSYAAASLDAWEELSNLIHRAQDAQAGGKAAQPGKAESLDLTDPFSRPVKDRASSAKPEHAWGAAKEALMVAGIKKPEGGIEPEAVKPVQVAERIEAPLARVKDAAEVVMPEKEVKPATKETKYGAFDDKSTKFEIDTKYYANKRETVMTDANGRKIKMETGEPDPLEKRLHFKHNVDVKSAEILDKNGKSILEIKDGKCKYQTQDGKTEEKDVDSVRFNPKSGNMEITFKDGASSVYRGDGSLTTFDSEKRPTYLRTGNGAEIEYHYDSDITGDSKVPSRITIDKAGVEFSYDKNSGLYRSTKDGAPVESAVSVGVGGGANAGVASAGVGLCVPVDKRQRIQVDRAGGLIISSAERPGEDTRVTRFLGTNGTMTELTSRTIKPSWRGIDDVVLDLFDANDYPTKTTMRRFGKDGTDLSLRTKPR